jgi:hypothetical protein
MGDKVMDVTLCEKEDEIVNPTDAELIHDGLIGLDDALSNFMEIKDAYLRAIFEPITYSLLNTGELILENLNGEE